MGQYVAAQISDDKTQHTPSGDLTRPRDPFPTLQRVPAVFTFVVADQSSQAGARTTQQCAGHRQAASD